MTFSESLITGLFIVGLVFSVLVSLFFIIKAFSFTIGKIEGLQKGAVNKPGQNG